MNTQLVVDLKRFDELNQKGIVNLTKEEHEELRKVVKRIDDSGYREEGGLLSSLI